MLREGLTVTSDPTTVTGAGVVVICVPTPLSEDGGPDLSAVRSAAEVDLGLPGFRNPGGAGVDNVPRHHRGLPVAHPGGAIRLAGGENLCLAFSPERIDPGNAQYGIYNTPKVVGGATPTCTDRAVTFYSQFIESVVPARGTREAEMAKLLENTYRHVNIALVNEIVQVLSRARYRSGK